MITVTLDGYALKVTGHAFFAEKGQDIVCAAESILAFTLAETMGKMYEMGLLAENEYRDIDGDMRLQVSPRPGIGEMMARVSYDTVMNGYRLLAGNYPEHLTLSNGGL